MPQFSDELRHFAVKLQTRNREIFAGVVDESFRSIVEGSELTGAPGQPVDTGILKASWQRFPEGDNSVTIATNVEYAPYIEDGANSRGPFQLRSAVGGFHSLAQTVAGSDRIVEAVAARVAGAG